MYRQSSTVLYFKRANRYFPVIEPILKKNGIPIEFKYLCVIESGLTNATSPAKAQGFWQFMASTGANYGLIVNDEIDMRDNLVASTEAACKYLRSLYNKFHSWTAAAAAYNCGENGLARRIDKQGTNVYYDIWLNSETTRYVYRILAMKLIMQNPRQYGYYLRHCDLYPPIPTRTATLSGQNVDLYQFARSHNTTYKVLRTLNPWIKTDMLKNKQGKTYTVQLPIENGTLYRHSGATTSWTWSTVGAATFTNASSVASWTAGNNRSRRALTMSPLRASTIALAAIVRGTASPGATCR
jgi:hypothetical protein